VTQDFVTAATVAGSAAFDPDASPPTRYDPGPAFIGLDLRPGRVVLIGSPPGSGKTAATLQIAVDVLRNHPDMKAMIANAETLPEDLLARILARLAELLVGKIMDKSLSRQEKDRLKATLAEHNEALARLAFLKPPFSLDHLAGASDKFRAKLIVVDYIQRFGHGKDQREELDGCMSNIRGFALEGAAMLVVSSIARHKNRNGSTYDGANLASYRGSGELEFGADSAYLLRSDMSAGIAGLECVKARFHRPANINLRFSPEYQRFDPGDPLDGFDAAPGAGGKKGK
jgi:replicative DNA helicase